MRGRYLEVTFRKGRAIAAYLYLPRRGAERAARVSKATPGLLTCMTNSSRLTTIRVLAFGVLVLATSPWAQERPPIAEQIGKTYGLDSFGHIEGIRYTFNADFPGVKLSRTWVWEPKDRPGLLRGERQRGHASEAYVPALTARTPPCRR